MTMDGRRRRHFSLSPPDHQTLLTNSSEEGFLHRSFFTSVVKKRAIRKHYSPFDDLAPRWTEIWCHSYSLLEKAGPRSYVTHYTRY